MTQEVNNKTICFSGGGTLGPVIPLLAMHEVFEAEYADYKAVWIGTPDGPERELVEKQGIVFESLKAGKLRRYVSFKNIVDGFRFFSSIVRSVVLLKKYKPSVCITAGGFTSVPVHIAAKMVGISTWVHQQDVQVGLANKIMGKFATKVTTALPESVGDFKNAESIGNPVRKMILRGSASRARKKFGIATKKPVVLVMGGGTGAAQINDLVVDSLPELSRDVFVVHLYGKERDEKNIKKVQKKYVDSYCAISFVGEEIADLYALADVVVGRAGFGMLSEMVALKKRVIVIPLEGHQEKNAAYFGEKGGVGVLYSGDLSSGVFVQAVLDNGNLNESGNDEIGKAMMCASSQELLCNLECLLKKK